MKDSKIVTYHRKMPLFYLRFLRLVHTVSCFCLRLRFIYMRFYEIVRTVLWVWKRFSMYTDIGITHRNRTEWVWNPFMCDII